MTVPGHDAGVLAIVPSATLLGLDGRFIRVTELTIGMGLRRSIDYGLAHNRFGVVLMSHSFFGRESPQRELDGIVASRSVVAIASRRFEMMHARRRLGRGQALVPEERA